MEQEQQEKQSGVFGLPCEVYSRVVGYMRPVKQWNPGKRAEFAMRLVFRADSQLRPRQIREDVPAEDINAALDRRFEGTPGY